MKNPSAFSGGGNLHLIGGLLARLPQPIGSAPVQVFGRRNDETDRTLVRPATKKRQGTKSRGVGRWLAARAMGDLISAPNSFAGGRPTRRVHQQRLVD
jgi:hypothetical protein